MNWPYAYTPAIWLPIATLILILALAIHSWRRRSLPGALPFTIALLFGALWAAGSALEFAAVEPAAKITWVKFQTAWQLPSATAITCFLLEYAWPGRWLTRRHLGLLSIFPLLVILLILTDDLHHLIWSGFVFTKTVAPLLGLVGWLMVAYAYGLWIVNLFVLAWLFRHSPQHRWVVVFLLAGQVFVRVVYLLDRIPTLKTDLPLEVFGIAFTSLMYSVALFGYRLLNPIPLARQLVIEQMREGMLVVDRTGRVASLNPAAAALLGMPDKQACGCLIQELLPSCANPGSGSAGESEISLGAQANTRDYLLATSLLRDWRGQAAGRLLLLHDVTEQKRAQVQLIDQQRALAVLREREHLARELHDELAQDLALINVQAQLVGGLLEAGQSEQAQAQLQTLAKTARAAQVAVRGEIGELSHRLTQGEGFFGALSSFMETFQHAYGIETELAVPEIDHAISFAPAIEVQLIRIAQEAFTNIRKHAGATQVQVALKRMPGCVELAIEDNGVGFDPAGLPASGRSFGLSIMSARAQEINGRVEVNSAPGEGTRVLVVVPVHGER